MKINVTLFPPARLPPRDRRNTLSFAGIVRHSPPKPTTASTIFSTIARLSMFLELHAPILCVTSVIVVRYNKVCSVRDRLAEQFAISARRYAEASVELGRTQVLQQDYARLFADAVDALRESQDALSNLKDHIDRHQCGRVAPVMLRAVVQSSPA
jgi:hypothetical protein